MTIVALRKIPASRAQWRQFHWNHWLDHKIILGVIRTKTGQKLFLPPIWPVPNNDYTPQIAEWHQLLHQQMDALSGAPAADMQTVDLSNPQGQAAFIRPNFYEHYVFHELVGVPV